MTTPEDVERAKREAVRAPDELCDSAVEHPLGLWVLCDARGPHSIHWGYEQVAPGVRNVRRWTDKESR